MSRNLVIVVVVVLVLIVGGWLLLRPKQSTVPIPVMEQTQTPVSTESASPTLATDGAMVKQETVVIITKSGFGPKNITISAGETVTWLNSDTADHIVNSVPHPTHTSYPSLNLGAIKPGDKKSLVFPKAGAYKYHDHLNPTLSGSVTVQ